MSSGTREQGIVPLTRMDVFDAGSIDTYVDGSLDCVYTPGEVAVFGYVHEAVKGVKERLQNASAEKTPGGHPFLARFSRDGKLYNTIETLGVTTEMELLEKLTVVTDAQGAEKGELAAQGETHGAPVPSGFGLARRADDGRADEALGDLDRAARVTLQRT